MLRLTKLEDVLTECNLVDLDLSNESSLLCDYNGASKHWVQCGDDECIALPHQDDVTVEYEDDCFTRWALIEIKLNDNIASMFELTKAIRTYNPSLATFKFDILADYVKNILMPNERSVFFHDLLPKVIQLALELPKLFPNRLRRLGSANLGVMFLTKHQISCLLANAFLCTFSKPKDYRMGVNFHQIFSSNHCSPARIQLKMEKLKCFMNYFRQVLQQHCTSDRVSLEWKTLHSVIDFASCDRAISNMLVSNVGNIEQDGQGYAQVDFANRFIGGGILDSGCVQEEILFAANPELIAARVVCNPLGARDALIITGSEKYNQHRGYGDTFTWVHTSESLDTLPKDKYNRRERQIIAMDATSFHHVPRQEQYTKDKINRELRKAISAFQPEALLKDKTRLPAIATGNWGCGAFWGDPYLKAFIQLLAASYHGRDLLYFTFGNRELCCDLEKIDNFFKNRPGITFATLYALLLEFASFRGLNPQFDLVTFLYQKL